MIYESNSTYALPTCFINSFIKTADTFPLRRCQSSTYLLFCPNIASPHVLESDPSSIHSFLLLLIQSLKIFVQKVSPAWQSICALPPCSLLFRGEGQVKYYRATLSVLSFHSFLSAAPSLHLSSSPDLLMSLLTQSSHLSCGLPLFLRP